MDCIVDGGHTELDMTEGPSLSLFIRKAQKLHAGRDQD